MVLKSSHERYADLRCSTHAVSILVNGRSSCWLSTAFGLLIFGVGDRGCFSLICLDNSPAVLFSAGTASSEGGIGGTMIISGIMVIGGRLGLPNLTWVIGGT